MSDIQILKSEMLSLSVGRFCEFSKTVSRMVPVTDLESMTYNALAF